MVPVETLQRKQVVFYCKHQGYEILKCSGFVSKHIYNNIYN